MDCLPAPITHLEIHRSAITYGNRVYDLIVKRGSKFLIKNLLIKKNPRNCKRKCAIQPRCLMPLRGGIISGEVSGNK